MVEQGLAWIGELKRYAAECRRQRPLPHRAELSLAEEAQSRIIGESLTKWLSENRTRLLQQGDESGILECGKRKPFLVFTSSQIGLVAARDILGKDASSSAFLLTAEFEDWEKTHPDKIHNWHVHFWSDIGPPGPWHYLTGEITKAEIGDEYQFVRGKSYFDKYPLSAGEAYWINGQGTTWGSLHGYGGDRLWKWKDTEAIFVMNLGRWVS